MRKIVTLALAAGVSLAAGTARAQADRPSLTNGPKAALPFGGPAARTGPATRYARLPLSFESNRGQTSREVRFLSRGAGYTLFLTDAEVVLTLPASRDTGPRPVATTAVRMRLAGGSPVPAMQGLEERKGSVNYFRGPDPKGWQTNVPTYGKVAYRSVYPGIDLVFYGNQGELEYDFLVAPGADPRAIRLAFEGTGAARLDREGNLLLKTRAGEIVQKAPVAYQHGSRGHTPVRARYKLAGPREVAILIGEYDPRRPLVIDPVLLYSTFLGGSGYDLVRGIATDRSGHAYVTGATASPDFPNTSGPPQGGWETFVTKIDPLGQNFVYSTFIAGSWSGGIAVDAHDRAYVTGSAVPGFSWTAGAYQTTFGGGSADAFAARLDAFGVLDWATFLGGSGYEHGFGIAVDDDYNPSVAGLTESTDFPAKSPFQAAYAGGANDAFVARFENTGSALIWSSFLGGTGFETGTGIAVDPARAVYLSGYSNSPILPDATPSCTTHLGAVDAFVAKVNPSGSLVYATCLGGNGADYGRAIAVDRRGHAYVAGATSSLDFPAVNAIQALKAGAYDAFVFKLEPSGSALLYSTYLGGGFDEYAAGIDVDEDGSAYVAGVTYSKDFPVKFTLQGFGGTPWADAFLFKVTPVGNGLVYSTFLGGRDDEDSGGFGTFVAVDVQHVAHVAGNTKSKDFPLAWPMVPSPAQPAHASPGVLDGWVARVQ